MEYNLEKDIKSPLSPLPHLNNSTKQQHQHRFWSICNDWVMNKNVECFQFLEEKKTLYEMLIHNK